MKGKLNLNSNKLQLTVILSVLNRDIYGNSIFVLMTLNGKSSNLKREVMAVIHCEKTIFSNWT